MTGVESLSDNPLMSLVARIVDDQERIQFKALFLYRAQDPQLEGCPSRKPVISFNSLSRSAAAAEDVFLFVSTEWTAPMYALVTSSYLSPVTIEGRATTTPPSWFRSWS